MVIRNVPMYQAKIPIRGGGGGGRVDLRNRTGANPIVEALMLFKQQNRQKEQDELVSRQAEADIAYRQKQTGLLDPGYGERPWYMRPEYGIGEQAVTSGSVAPSGPVGTAGLYEDPTGFYAQAEQLEKEYFAMMAKIESLYNLKFAAGDDKAPYLQALLGQKVSGSTKGGKNVNPAAQMAAGLGGKAGGQSGRVVVGDGKTWLIDPTTGEKRDLGIIPPRSKVGDRSVTDIINDISKISGAAGKIPTSALDQTVIDEAIGGLRRPLMDQLGLEEYDVPAVDRQWPIPNKPARKGARRKTPITEALGKPAKKAAGKARPPKPKGYPNAVWSEEHKMWTVVQNGRLMGVK